MVKLSSLICTIVFLTTLGCSYGRVTEYLDRRPNKSLFSGKETEGRAAFHYLKSRMHYLNVEGNQGLAELEKAAMYDPNPYILFDLAYAYLQAGRTQAAEGVINKLLQGKNAADEEVLYLAAEIYERQGRYEEAQDKYKEIIAQDKSAEVAWYRLSQLYNKMHDLPGTLKSLQELLAIYPNNDRAHYHLANLNRRMGQFKSAKIHYRKALKFNPSLVEAWRNLASVYEQENNTLEALNCYQKITEVQPGDEYAHSRIIQIYLIEKKPQKAIQYLAKLERIEPDNIQIKLNLGKIHFEEGEFDKALVVYQNILQLKPDFHSIRFYQGVVLEEMDRIEDAIITFQEIPPEATIYIEASLHLAYLLQKQSEFDSSLAVLKNALKFKPDVPELYDLTASAHERKGEIDLAVQTLEESLKYHDKNERINYHLGALYDQVGRFEDCVFQMKKVINLNPNHASALNYLGYTYTENNVNIDEAYELIHRAMTIRPDDGFIIDSLAWIQFKRGNFEESLKLLKKAQKIVPEEPIVYEHLGDVYLALGQRKRAREYLTKALVINQNLSDPVWTTTKDIERIQAKLIEMDKEKSAEHNSL